LTVTHCIDEKNVTRKYDEEVKVPDLRPKNDGRNEVKSSTQDEAEGKLHKVKGSIKEIAGKVTKNRKLVRKGKAEKAAGEVQEKIGQVKKVFGK
jgi:uncharacterized protein YjbJ (UPF0337 family)